jgi:hypothetical protein
MPLDVRVVSRRIDEEQSPKSEAAGEEVPLSSVLDRLVKGPPFVEIALILSLSLGEAIG